MEALGMGSKELHYSNMAFREYLVEVGFWKRRAPGRRVWRVLKASFRIVVYVSEQETEKYCEVI